MEKYWYCGVAVKGVRRVYSYISDEGEITPGSYVLVSFGNDDSLRIGEVRTCTEYTEEDAPYPPDKTKHIIRIASQEEYEDEPAVPSHADNFPKDPFDNGDMDWETVQASLEEADFFIKNEDWDDAFGWACAYHSSTDEKIIQKVIECYRLCADHGMAVAALNLGTFYYEGRGVEQDYVKAYELYKSAADEGVPKAFCNVGYCFYYGRHQEVDYEKAYEYFSLGAMLHNDANCLYKLGDMFSNGYYVEKNERYAFILYARAFNVISGDEDFEYCLADVQFRIGKCLLYGAGVNKDVERAHDLLSRALDGFYERRKSDIFVGSLIARTKKLILEAEEVLDGETLGNMNNPLFS